MHFGFPSVALRNLRRKPLRSGILALSIGIFVAMFVFGLSFIRSVGASIERAQARLGADVLVVPPGARDYAEEVLLETKIKAFYMDRSIMERVRVVEGIGEITQQTYLETILGVCCDVPAAKIAAFNQDTDFIVGPWLQKALGRRLKPGEAIIGAEAYDNLGLLEVSSSVLFNKKFDFVGVLEKTGTGLDNAIFVGDENLDEIVRGGKSGVMPGQISVVFAKVKSGYDPYLVSRAVENAILEVDVMARSDMGKGIMHTLGDIRRVFLTSMAMTASLAVFLMWTVFSAIVNERRREVGIIKALGAGSGDVVRLFAIEVLALGLMGGLMGIALGTYLSLSLSQAFVLLRETAASLTILERVSIAALGIVVGGAISMIGALSGMYALNRIEPLGTLKES